MEIDDTQFSCPNAKCILLTHLTHAEWRINEQDEALLAHRCRMQYFLLVLFGVHVVTRKKSSSKKRSRREHWKFLFFLKK